MERFGQQRDGTFIVQRVELSKENQVSVLEQDLINLLIENKRLQSIVKQGEEAKKAMELNTLEAERLMKNLLKLRGEENEN